MQARHFRIRSHGAPTPPQSSGRGAARTPLVLALAAALAAAAVLRLAWIDVLPGGWRLRTLFVPQAVQDLRRRAVHRAERLSAFRAEPLPAPGGTLFIGSSTIERFPLERLLPDSSPINRGIGDEDLTGLEARATATAKRLKPKTVVLYAGSVNARRAVDDGSWTPPQEIVRRASDLASALLSLGPVEAVVLLGILPEREMPPDLSSRIADTNAGLSALVERPGIYFLPTSDPQLVDGQGRLRPSVSADRLHLNDLGYEALSHGLRPLLEKLR